MVSHYYFSHGNWLEIIKSFREINFCQEISLEYLNDYDRTKISRNKNLIKSETDVRRSLGYDSTKYAQYLK